jgi:hypothetical protein
MAKFFPDRPPQSIIDDPSRRAELRVFEALKGLPEKYRVFYSLHWQSHQPFLGAKEGEADFIIAHPDMGVIILEVKGGGIRYDAERDLWYSHSMSGSIFNITDPIEQGRRNHYELMRKFEQLPSWPEGRFNIWHAVCFPDIHLTPGQYLKLDLPRDEVIDKDDLNDITASVYRVFSHCFGQDMKSGSPDNDRMRIIESLLAHSFEFSSPLAVELEHEDRKLFQLTEQQFLALSILGDRKRVAIAGCAGSGKTMLATHKAKQFADLGMSVLFVCFNIALSEDLRKKLPFNIEVYHFHELCRTAIQQAGDIIPPSKDVHDLFDHVLPEALLDSAVKIGPVYDAIIVDEGQDFQENYWTALEPLLKDEGYLYVFYDDNQNLYGGMGTFGGLITETPFPLTQNCRNTQSIHQMVIKYHNHPDGLVCFGPPGRKPETITYLGEEGLIQSLQKLLHRLIVEEHLSSEDIVILTPRGEKTTKLTPGTKLGLFTLTNQPPDHLSKIQATSIYKFKGLERRVVILAEIDNRSSFNREMVMYVGCSRARVHLVILADENAQEIIKDKLNSST